MKNRFSSACTVLAPMALGCVGSSAFAQDAANSAAQEQTVEPIDRLQPTDPGQSIAPPTPRSTEQPLYVEVGVMPRLISNYFQAQDDFNLGGTAAPAETVHITTLSGAIGYDFTREKGRRLTAEAKVRRNIFLDYDNADSTDFDASLRFAGKSDQIEIGYSGTRHRLVSVSSAGKTFGETDAFHAQYLHNLTKQLRGRVDYRFTKSRFGTTPDRNISEHEVRADLRYKVSRYFMPSIGGEYRRGKSPTGAYSYRRTAGFVSVTSDIDGKAYLNVRYRLTGRHYLTDVPTDSYSGREDDRGDISFYGTLFLSHGFSIFAYGSHTDNNSNQPSHAFKSDEIGLGLFKRF